MPGPYRGVSKTSGKTLVSGGTAPGPNLSAAQKNSLSITKFDAILEGVGSGPARAAFGDSVGNQMRGIKATRSTLKRLFPDEPDLAALCRRLKAELLDGSSDFIALVGRDDAATGPSTGDAGN